MSLTRKFGKTALVVGASTTVGEQFARQLAAAGMDVVLVARRLSLLESIAAEIRRDHGVQARPVALDLTAEDSLEKLEEATKDLAIDLLVINANLHTVGKFHAMDRATKRRMLRMNVEVPMLLVDTFGAKMVERGRGAVVFVNVLNSLAPIEIDGIFQGTKAFLRLFAESLWLEYRRHGVQVSTVLVNGIEGSASYEEKLSPAKRTLAKVIGGSMDPKKIVGEAIREIAKGRWLCVPDYTVPINQVAVTTLETLRAFGGPGAAILSSELFGFLLDGPGSQTGRS